MDNVDGYRLSDLCSALDKRDVESNRVTENNYGSFHGQILPEIQTESSSDPQLFNQVSSLYM